MSTAEEVNARKLIDRLIADSKWGPMAGLVATTYELQPDFLEMDFLPSLFQLGAWDDRSWATRVGMERKLAELESAWVFMDSRCYRGRPRSLRIGITPVNAPRGAALHAKVYLLLFEKAVRLVVGSPNLTEPGFRRNREVAAVFTITETNRQDGEVIRQALAGMQEFLAPWLPEESKRIIERAQAKISEWKEEEEQEAPTGFVWSGGGVRLWHEFLGQWPEYDQVKLATIISPFWSADAGLTLTAFISELRTRRLLAPGCVFRLLTEVHCDPEGKYLPVLPTSYATGEWTNLGVKVEAQAVAPNVLPEEVGDMEGFTGTRRLHAKVVTMQGARTSLAYLGSANFTAHGWGFLREGTPANIEAGVILRQSAKSNLSQALLPDTVGKAVDLTTARLGDLQVPEGQGDAQPWPEFVKRALLVPKDQMDDCLLLEIEVADGSASEEWSASLPAKDDHALEVLLPREKTQAESTVFQIPLDDRVLNRLLLEQEIIISWKDCAQGCGFPLNVSLQARDRLPITPGSNKLAENHLLSYYQGKIAWEDLFPDPEGESQNGHRLPAGGANLSVVDKSKIQSYQIREFVEALTGIAADLKAATQSEPSMRLALLGAVSPVALARTVIDAAKTGTRTATAAGFQLTEILGCLQQARRYKVSERLTKSWLEYLHQATAALTALLKQLETDHPEELNAGSSFRRYSRAVLGRKAAQ